MFLSVDISFFIIEVFQSVLDVMFDCIVQLDNIIIFNGVHWGLGDFTVSLLDFNIGLVVTAIVIGAFIHVNKADNFYSNRKD